MFKDSTYRNVTLYALLVIGLTFILFLSEIPFLKMLGQMMPFLVLIPFLLFSKRPHRFRELGLSRIGHYRWYFVSLIIIGLLIISFLLAWVTGFIQLPPASQFPNGIADHSGRFILLLKTFFHPAFFLTPLLFSLFEEVGWRGYLQARLQPKLGLNRTVLYTALIWTLFHLPFIFMGGYYTSGHFILNTALFTIAVFILSIFMGYMRAYSQSLWPVIFLHAGINHIRSFFDILFYNKQSNWTYVTGESGLYTLLLWSGLILLIWLKQNNRQQLC
ncbi:CPBP family intramembrane metalloprotease [Hazenella sp. IB182353]|uniref:CPBP family intramembrane glutamic endopeptidase n=1 Tax=Polycladospora coralii TaxID=2771432 RepID=UPI0017464957|nr:type II CAAX endopeptidase family protein [Polycladospora coralii]MBS7531236.1 CPBP family intramembrane metalloprotease [Polycladospora coralii]